jgi:spore germination protein GerM
MSRRRALLVGGALVAIALLAWGATRGVEHVVSAPPSEPLPGVVTPPAATAHINVTLYYASQDGEALVPVRREVPLAEGTVAQGAQILAAQFDAAPAPFSSVIPKGTKLRAFYVIADRGDAFVDLSREISTAHAGGTLSELLTVYAIVNAVTANLPAVQRVQLLVDGKEVDTIAGHVDVRRPLVRDRSLVREKEK